MRLASSFLLAAAILACSSAAIASEEPPALKPGMGFGSARSLLISKGFLPVRSGSQRTDRCSAGRQDVCVSYPETVSCDGTGAAACKFIYTSKAGTTLTVVADGDDAGHLKVVAARKAAKADAEWQRKSR